MSDPEVPQDKHPRDVDDVVGSANEGLDAAAAARGEVPARDGDQYAPDPDMAAFDAAERDHPGTFVAPDGAADRTDGERPVADARGAEGGDDVNAGNRADDVDAGNRPDAYDRSPHDQADDHVIAQAAAESAAADRVRDSGADDDDERTRVMDLSGRDADDDERTRVMPVSDAASDRGDADRDTARQPAVAGSGYADQAYSGRGDETASDADTRLMPSEPVAPPPAAQPIFVQAPEPPREHGNRGAAGLIGLVAAVCFAVLYLAAILALGALRGEVTVDTLGDAVTAPLTMWSFWVPVVVFFLSFWLLGAIVNRARWGVWVIFGLLVGAATYAGHLLGQLVQAPFWRLTATESTELVEQQLLAPLAIAAFLFARELTIWFGAWVARSGARKKELNAQAQAEYERTLEAGPAALR